MLKISHFLGSILLIVGTTVGVGIIALPVGTASAGFFPSIGVFFGCWLLMLATAMFFLDVNFSVNQQANLISMAKKTLGSWAQGLSWVVYLLLLYSLTAAYIAGSGPLFSTACLALTGYPLQNGVAVFILPIVFGGFIYFGTQGVDVVNRVMMIGLVITYFLLAIFLPEHLHPKLLFRAAAEGAGKKTLAIIPIVILSFGYHIIIPSLTTYMGGDKKKLRWALVIGSMIPLLLYVIWQTLILGAIPFYGENGLLELKEKGETFTRALAAFVGSKNVVIAANFFSFFAIVTSFLGVTLSLSDFLIDGLKIKKTWEGKLLAMALTFIPPLVFVFTYQRGFYLALDYAGIFVAILLVFLPAMMAWRLKEPKFYQTVWGKLVLSFTLIVAIALVAITAYQTG